MSRWENITMGLKYDHQKLDHDSKDAQDYFIKEKEVALKHSETGAVVRLTDDGFVDVFAGPELGIRLDPTNNSLNLFGDSVNVIANQFNIKTKPYGFSWNGRAFNPALYSGEQNEVMTQMRKKVRYSDGMISIMKDFGLPVESADKEDSNG